MIDNHRAMYYNTIAFREWGARENYHLMINSCTFGIELCAELICQAAKKYMNTSDLSQQ